jgi:hypothetical protein
MSNTTASEHLCDSLGNSLHGFFSENPTALELIQRTKKFGRRSRLSNCLTGEGPFVDLRGMYRQIEV